MAKRIPKFEIKKFETICIEIILFASRSPNFSKTKFFEEIYVTLNKALNEYDNLLLTGNLNIIWKL